MNVVIVGAGMVGYSLAQYFSNLEYHVVLIEQNESLCEQIRGKLDILVIHGKGSSPAALESAGIRKADILIAVTPSDETNLLACNFAMQSGVQKRIARIKSDIYPVSTGIDLSKLGVTNVIQPELEVVRKILQYVELPGVIETANFQSGNIYLRGYRVTEDMPIAHKTLSQIRLLSEMAPILVVAIVRNDRSLPPTGAQQILPDDRIIAIMPQSSFWVFRTLINQKEKKLHKIIVSGDSLTAIHLANALKPLCEQIMLIDPDQSHGQMAASELDGIDVFHGDSTDSDILQELNVHNADYFIAAGKDSEDNIMSCILAKNMGARMVIAQRNNERYMELFNSLGIDHVINPQDITSNMIIEQIQMVPIGTYLKLKTADIEIIRLKVTTKSPVIHKSLQELHTVFQKSIIVGSIVRSNEVIIPWGEISFEDNDEVIMFCFKEQIKRVSKLFGR
ncbi:MAG: Trk system potassium transporter TrkA [bacterium]